MKKLIVVLLILIAEVIISWYFDIWHKPVETVDELIGQSYNYAHKIHFQKNPTKQYTVNINDNLNEFDGGILSKKEILIDSLVQVYTWDYMTHQKIIWVGNTEKLKSQVIDAIRYNNRAQF